MHIYRLKTVTVSMEPSGKYYASLLYEISDCENQTGVDYEDAKILGIDYAMRGMAVFSENIKKEDDYSSSSNIFNSFSPVIYFKISVAASLGPLCSLPLIPKRVRNCPTLTP